MASTLQPMAPRSSRAGAASAVPLWLGLGSAIASLVIAVIVAIGFSVPIELFLGIALPLVQSEYGWLSLIGYLLTPLLVIVCVGWDRIAQRKGVRSNPNFAVDSRYSAVLLWTTWPAIVLGVWHILNLSVPLSEAWGLS